MSFPGSTIGDVICLSVRPRVAPTGNHNRAAHVEVLANLEVKAMIDELSKDNQAPIRRYGTNDGCLPSCPPAVFLSLVYTSLGQLETRGKRENRRENTLGYRSCFIWLCPSPRMNDAKAHLGIALAIHSSKRGRGTELGDQPCSRNV